MRSPAFALLLAAAVLSTLPALADTFTYTYTGNHFNTFNGTGYNPTNFVSGSFTLAAPLAPNTPLSQVAPLSFSFSDGTRTISSVNPAATATIDITAGANGSITEWLIDTRVFVGVSEYIQTGSAIAGSGNTPFDTSYLVGPTQTGGYSLIGQGSVAYEPGTWTETTNITSAATPEPTSLLLLASGALGMGAMRVRSRFARSRNA